MNEQDAEMLEQINRFLSAMSPPDPDGMYAVAKVDNSVDPVELYRQSLAMGNGHVWYVGTEKCATAITGNGPRAKKNAEFYAAAPVFVRWLLNKLATLAAERDALAYEFSLEHGREWPGLGRIAVDPGLGESYTVEIEVGAEPEPRPENPWMHGEVG